MIIKDYFKVYSVHKQTKRKFSSFDENHGLTNPFEENPKWRLCKIHIFIVYESLFLRQWSSKHYFQAYFVPETIKDNIFIFSLKSRVNPFEKIPVRQVCKIHFL